MVARSSQAVVLVVLATACFLPARAVADDWRRRLESEGLEQQAKLESFYRQLEGSFESDLQGSADQGAVYRFLFSGDWRLITTIRDPERKPPALKNLPREGVLGSNSHYNFLLRRKAEADPYLLRYCGKVAGEPFETIEPKYMKSVFAPVYVNFKPFREWFTTAGFKVDSIGPVAREGHNYVTVSVRYTTSKESKRNGDAGFEGSLTLDPARYWCICEVDVKLHFRSEGTEFDVPWRTAVDYGTPLKDMPVPRSVTHTVGGPPSKRVLTKETWTIRDLVHRKAGEHEFTLTAFGLPEIMEDAPLPPRSFLWLWLLGLGALLVGGAIALRWRIRRAAA